MPIPEGHSACVAHFVRKGKPVDQANAICYSVERRRKSKRSEKVAEDYVKGVK